MPSPFRQLPSLNELLESPQLKSLVERVNQNTVVTGVRQFLGNVSSDVQAAWSSARIPTPQELAQKIADWISTQERAGLQSVVNATGILLPPKAGGAPLPEEALQAMSSIAANYVESLGAHREGEHWVTSARDVAGDNRFNIRSRVLINACGPYVDAQNARCGETTEYRHLFSKGIHLVVDRITDNKRVLTFFASDGRLFFLIPMGSRTCIGTTDTQVDSPEVVVTDEDRDFVLANANALLDLDPPLSRASIIAERVGVRPLAIKGHGGEADWVALSRKHVIEVNKAHRHLSIFGGKLTDCLNVGDEVTAWVKALGIAVPEPKNQWYGEPGAELRRETM